MNEVGALLVAPDDVFKWRCLDDAVLNIENEKNEQK